MFRSLSLKTFVFFWMLIAVAVPLVTLLVAATQYSRHLYEDEVRRDITSALNRTVAAFDRRIFIERDLIGGLSKVPAMREYLPVLDNLKKGSLPSDFAVRTEILAHFFASFQRVRRSLGTVRVLDHNGNTLIKVSNGKRLSPNLRMVSGTPVVESGFESDDFRQALDELRPNDVGSLLFPPRKGIPNAVFNTVLPLKQHDAVVGYLVTEAPLGPLDRTLDMVARPKGANLIVAEVNSENRVRDGMVLYSDASGMNLSKSGKRPRLADVFPYLSEQAFFESEGVIPEQDGSVIYYTQYWPYPDQLLSWTFVFQLEGDHLAAPFQHTRYVIWIGILMALAIALLVAHFGVGQVTAPVAGLARQLIGFAKGDRTSRLEPVGPKEMSQAYLAFNEMADSLQQAEEERDSAQNAVIRNAKLASVGQLAAGIGHELSNPLSNIYSLTKLAQRRLSEDDSVRHDVDLIREEAERASNIIKGLLSFARQGPTNPTHFDVGEWIRESVSLVERLAQNRDVRVSPEEVGSCELQGDRGLLQQALVNVLVNAIQATPRGSEVRVLVELVDRDVCVSVEDQGGGVDQEAVDRIFDPFFTTKPEGEGTGLGLSIAMGIMERHSGNVELINREQGNGARATLRIPCAGNLQDKAEG